MQELPTIPEHLNSPPVFSGVRVTRSLALCVCFVDRCLSFCLFSFGHCAGMCSSFALWFCIYIKECVERERERERVLNKSLKWLKRILESGDDNSLSLVPVNSKIPR